MNKLSIAVVLPCLMFLTTAVPPAAADNPAFLVIVNASNPIGSLNRRMLADIFVKRITHWPEDGVVQPVDLQQDSPVRRRFSEEILNRSVMGIKSYWQQLIFSGQDVPPPELKNDAEVIQFIVKNPNSVGYVSGALEADISGKNGIKAVSIK